MRRVWYTSWPFLAAAAVIASILMSPLRALLTLACAGVLVAVAMAILLRWNSYKEPK